MRDLIPAFLTLLAAVSLPNALARRNAQASPGRALAGCAVAFGLLASAMALRGAVMEGLDVSPESFRIAAGAIMGPAALRSLWRGARPGRGEPPGGRWAETLVALALVSPASVAAAMSGADRWGMTTMAGAGAVLAVVCAAALTLLRTGPSGRGEAIIDALARANGAVLAVAAVGMVVSGVESV
ncbi:MAG: hypothetical protein EXR43_01000 [Dehalococcoidia bacterium]|nr:hypothetical protein [Dehalococcoidia bacterium]